MNKIIIRNFLLPIYIGIYEKEKKDSQNVLINIELEVLNKKINDDIKNVVDYGDIVQKVSNLAEGKHINLVETLTEEIASICLSYDSVALVRVRVEKTDIFDKVDGVGIEIERKK